MFTKNGIGGKAPHWRIFTLRDFDSIILILHDSFSGILHTDKDKKYVNIRNLYFHILKFCMFLRM